MFKDLPNEKMKFNKIKIEEKLIDQEALDISIDEFKSNDMILIKSGTGTSKTKLIAKLAPQIKEDKYKFLSIVNLRSLAEEQINTFKEESNTDLKNYQDNINDLSKNDGVICLNSLIKLQELEDFNISDRILFIDEINDLIQSITHNDKMTKVLNKTYVFLINLIKNCKKIILTDATINQNTLNFLSARKTNNKIILIKNTHKKFMDVPAIHYNNKFEFIDELRTHIKNKDYFMFGCDICAEISSIYSKLILEFPEQKDDFILITGDTNVKIKNANKQFLNKYVFYSPSITTGISFAYKGQKQTQFIYMSYHRFISPESFYQMSCRTRNMKQLIWYSEDMKDIKHYYETLKDCKKHYKNMIKTNEKILNLCKSTNRDDESEIVDNCFFNLWCYEEYKIGLFKTGFKQHYINILSNSGFVHSEKGEYKKLTKEENEDLKECYKTLNNVKFADFLEFQYPDETEEQLKKTKKDSKCYADFMKRKEIRDKMNHDEIYEHIKENDEKFKVINERNKILGILTFDETVIFKEFLTDEHSFKRYTNTLCLFKTTDHINYKLKNKEGESFYIKICDSVYNKVLLIEKFEKHYKLERFRFNFDHLDLNKHPVLSEEIQKLYVELFESKKTNFKDKHSLLLIYVNMIRNIAGGPSGLPIINMKETKIKVDDKWKKSYEYTVNTLLITRLITIAKNNNPELKYYNLEMIEKLTKLKPSKKVDIYSENNK